ncbi:hypothetical protein [Streptomyces sp. TLI_105]|nr:hypothetical protein [Streptomyces sp. TLI_105]
MPDARCGDLVLEGRRLRPSAATDSTSVRPWDEKISFSAQGTGRRVV